MELLNVKNLSFTYSGAKTPAINDISFTLNEGDLVVMCGRTGCGKSTFLRLLKEELRPLGDISGSIEYKKERPVIGFVMQNPKEQVVTDKVWHELAFGMENLGIGQKKMAARIAEMSEYFGIGEWYDKSVNELSGGQLQILNLASVMVTDPDILILDEPSAQLDPVSTADFFAALRRLNKDFALTIIIAEHRLEELLEPDDRLLVMDNGRVVCDGIAKDAVNKLTEDSPVFDALPAPYRLFRKLRKNQEDVKEDLKSLGLPLTIREGRELVRGLVNDIKPAEKTSGPVSGNEPALEMKGVYFRYDRYSDDVLSDFDLTVNKGEIFCLLGGNGSGKTTALKVAAGLAVPYSGTVKVFSKKLKEYKNQSLYNGCVSMLPQDVQTLFMYNTVREEFKSMGIKDNIRFAKDIDADKHPYDLSGGEQQIVGLEKVLAADPKLLLLDEPTKGMDPEKKREFVKIVKSLKESGVTVFIVTHDVEFAACCADRCALCFRGAVSSTDEPVSFFENNGFYTTSICRMTKGICEGSATLDGFIDRYISKDRKVSAR